jgi:hypothetical protein
MSALFGFFLAMQHPYILLVIIGILLFFWLLAICFEEKVPPEPKYETIHEANQRGYRRY